MNFSTMHAIWEDRQLADHTDGPEPEQDENEPYLITDKKTGMMRWSHTGLFAFCWVAKPSRKEFFGRKK